MLVSCDTDHLVAPQQAQKGHLTVKYDWSSDPEASPEGMRLWFYPLSGSENTLIDFSGREGGRVDVAEGDFAVISYNNDSDVNLFDFTDATESHAVSTGETTADWYSPTRADINDMPLRLPPSEIWTAVDTVTIAPADSLITLRPAPLHRYYNFICRHVSGLENVSQVEASICGMAQGVRLRDTKLSTEECLYPLPAKINRKDSTITGSFLCFGPADNDEVRNRLHLYITTNAGMHYRITQGDKLDVTDQVRQAPDPRHVTIVLDSLAMPTSASDSQQAYNPTVDDWPEVNINVNI